MSSKIVAIVIDATNATPCGMMLARLFNTVVNVRIAANILQVVSDLRQTSPDVVLYPSDINEKIVHALLREKRAHREGLRFVVIGCKGLTKDDAAAVERRAMAA